MLPVVLSGVTLTAWRGYSRREPVAILLSTSRADAVLLFFLEIADAAGRRYMADVPVAGRLCRHRHQHRDIAARKVVGVR